MTMRKLQSVKSPLRGSIKVPGDKSISHRSVMFGAIAEGETTVSNFLLGDDCLSTISCFRKLGVKIEQEHDLIHIQGKGFAGLEESREVLDVGNSGTTIRLLMGILSGSHFHTCLIGDDSIAKRPMTRVTTPLKKMGALIDGRKNGEFIPISIRGGHLKGMCYEMPVASAQVKSSILFAGLQAEGETTVIESSPTRDHTERMIQKFGGTVEKEGNKITITGGQKLKGTHVDVPGDISSAAFFLVAAAITPGSEVLLKDVGLNPTRTGILDVLADMGADFEISVTSGEGFEPIGNILIKFSNLKGTVIEGDIIPRLIDEIPIIALLATQATGTTVIKNAEELKVKETNRIDTVVNELKKLGAQIEATDDGMVIYGRSSIKGGRVSSHGDHRIGMMLSVASLISNGEVYLENQEAISVSYPQFFSHLESLTC